MSFRFEDFLEEAFFVAFGLALVVEDFFEEAFFLVTFLAADFFAAFLAAFFFSTCLMAFLRFFFSAWVFAFFFMALRRAKDFVRPNFLIMTWVVALEEEEVLKVLTTFL